MKKLLLVAACAASILSARAAKVKIATVVVGGRAELTQAVNKIGELSCNAMLSGLAAGVLAEQTLEPTEYVLFVDDAFEPSFEKTTATNKVAKLGKGVVARLSVNPNGVRKICTKKEIADELTDDLKLAVKDFAGAAMTVRVNEKGLTVEGNMRVVEGSELIKKYPVGAPLAKDALAFAAKDCLMAAVSTVNGGSDYATLRRMIEICLKYVGTKVDCLTVGGEGGDCLMTLDAAKAVALAKTGAELLEKIDQKALEAELKALDQKATLPLLAGKCSLALKGYTSEWTLAERFAATLPEFVSKPLINMSVCSYYSTLKALAPHVLPLVPAESAEMVKGVLAALPAEQKGAIATALWQKNPSCSEFVYRISADEIKSFGMASGAVMSAVMSAAMADLGADDDDDDDDED